MADTLELEQLAARLEESGDYRILRRIPEVDRYADDDGAPKRLGLIVDIETTGLDPDRDKIIELAVLPFEFSSEGAIYDVQDGYAGFEDPGTPLPEEVVRLTGITDDQVRGHRLDDRVVDALVAPANLVIAHNAAFDRRFLERRFQLFVEKPWACSMVQVPWAEEGVGSRKLDYILGQLGFFFDDHRAMVDGRAVLHLLSLRLPTTGRSVFQVLLENARRRAVRIWALETPFDCKEVLKERGYTWNSGEDGRPRAWFTDVDDTALEDEREFLAREIYGGEHRYQLTRIDYSNRFSDRV